MVWTKLLHVQLPQAISSSVVKGRYIKPMFSNRWKNVLRKEFTIQGVPWTYEPVKEDTVNPRDKTPKRPKWIRNKALRLSELKSLIEKNDQIVAEYRREHLNNRKYKGVARFIKEFTPSWLSYMRAAANSKGPSSKSSADVYVDPNQESFAQKKQPKPAAKAKKEAKDKK